MNASHWLNQAMLPILPAILVAGALEVLVRSGVVPSFLVPAPSTVARTLATADDLWRVAGETAVAAGLGFLASAVIGVILAVGLASAQWVQRMFYPYAVIFQTVPIVAIAPLLVIWLGFGLETIVASAFIVSVFPIIANTLTGLRSTDPALRDLFQLYGARPMATLLKLRLPAALPAMMTGLRVAGGLAVIGAIVGEFITGSGIGGEIVVARQQQKIDRVFAGLLLAAGLGIALFGLINAISYGLLRHWHASERKT
ncbi:MAG TPA: ABC transporter permease [Tepidisphaeraceae bacterium]|jgi:NitT/TauT family transport system permease protein|nr:ABC transporter permease [Tepidisphaeraceae bacterium]